MKKRKGVGDSHVSGLHGGAIHKDGAQNVEMCLKVVWARLGI